MDVPLRMRSSRSKDLDLARLPLCVGLGCFPRSCRSGSLPFTNWVLMALRSLVLTPSMTTSDLSTHSTASLISNEEQFEDYGEGDDVDCAPSSPCPDDETRTNVYSDLGSSVSSRWPPCSGVAFGVQGKWQNQSRFIPVGQTGKHHPSLCPGLHGSVGIRGATFSYPNRGSGLPFPLLSWGTVNWSMSLQILGGVYVTMLPSTSILKAFQVTFCGPFPPARVIPSCDISSQYALSVNWVYFPQLF